MTSPIDLCSEKSQGHCATNTVFSLFWDTKGMREHCRTCSFWPYPWPVLSLLCGSQVHSSPREPPEKAPGVPSWVGGISSYTATCSCHAFLLVTQSPPNRIQVQGKATATLGISEVPREEPGHHSTVKELWHLMVCRPWEGPEHSSMDLVGLPAVEVWGHGALWLQTKHYVPHFSIECLTPPGWYQ